MSVIEDMRRVLQDFLAPELRAIAGRMGATETQRAEDRTDLFRLLDKMEKPRAEDKADLLRALADSTASMQKRFELVIDYTKVLQRIDGIEESQQSKEH